MDIDDMRRVEHILAALVRHREDGVDHVLRLLRKQYARDEKRLMQWMSPWIVKLAGYMHLSKAIPLLLDCLSEEAEVADEVGPALASIGTEEVVQAVSRKWWQAEMMGRFGLTEPLEKIHCGLALERALAFLDREAHFEVQMQLGHAVLGHFHECGIEPVRQMVTGRDDDLDNEQRDLRHKPVGVATAMGADFPKYKAWHKDAVQTDYGWGDRPVVPIRLAFEGDMDAVLAAYKPK